MDNVEKKKTLLILDSASRSGQLKKGPGKMTESRSRSEWEGKNKVTYLHTPCLSTPMKELAVSADFLNSKGKLVQSTVL